MKYQDLKEQLKDGSFDKALKELYGSSVQIISHQRKRYLEAVEKFNEYFPEHDEVQIYSAPGRTEIGGNHTDHQHGCVLAAAVDPDIIAVAAFQNDDVIHLKPKGHSCNLVKHNEQLQTDR